MSAIDSYGEMDLPEEKSVIEVVEDPVKTVLSCYDLFKFKVSTITNDYNWMHIDKKRTDTYSAGLKVFEEKTELKADAKQIQKIMAELKNKATHMDGTGLFLSALINSTKIDDLIIPEFPENLDYPGYCIKKNKIIILEPKNKVYMLGKKADGGTTINQAEITHQGNQSKAGNHINAGIIFSHQGLASSGGNYINIGKLIDQGYNSKNGNCINKGNLKCLGGYSGKGNFINQGNVNYWSEGYKPEGRHINLGKVDEKKDFVIDLSQKKNKHKTKLEQKLSELDFLQETEPQKLILLIRAYDWKKWEKELNEICKEIKWNYEKP